mmetsp:Transcript_57740/g.135025  ORF Transcript_57740/g.135025 Transcript_57740/m.135025 type:complete len:103 (+) Transcript_57740:183-491(+)
MQLVAQLTWLWYVTAQQSSLQITVRWDSSRLHRHPLRRKGCLTTSLHPAASMLEHLWSSAFLELWDCCRHSQGKLSCLLSEAENDCSHPNCCRAAATLEEYA